MLSKQTPETINIIEDTVIRGAYHAHSENILTSLFCSDDRDNRSFAVDVILQIRKGKNVGDVRVRIHKTPKINREATSLRGLINLNVDINEPVFTCKLSIDRLKQLLHCPLKVPKYSVYTQSSQRAIHEVALSTQAVYGQDRRDDWVRGRIDHRDSGTNNYQCLDQSKI